MVEEFFPRFQPYIREFLLGNVGLSGGTLQVADTRTGKARSPDDNRSPYGDRFKILIPYASHSITWEVVFDSMRPHLAPDFLFSDDFLSNPPPATVMEENLPSLAHWDHNNEKAFLQVVNELLLLYKKYQVDLLEELGTRFQFEYSSLVGVASIKEDDVEVLIGSGNGFKKSRVTSGGGVTFLIRLNVDFTCLPPGPDSRNYGEERALLRVRFYTTDLSRILPELLISPRIEAVLEKANSLRLPSFTAHDCLMDYVPHVHRRLQDTITTIRQVYEKRKELMAALMHEIGNSVIEFDSVMLTSATFLLERHDFFFLLHVNISEQFPKEKPVFSLQSVYHCSSGKPFVMNANDYPYGPKWQANVIVERALKYIYDLLNTFQQDSVESVAQAKY